MKDKQYNIEECRIIGIKNPTMFLKMNIYLEDFDIIVKADGKVIDNECQLLSGKSEILVKATLEVSNKIVSVFIKTNNEEFEVLSTKCGISKRVGEKFKIMTSNFTRKIKVGSYTIYKGLRFLWREYHFLVPISMWKKYFMDFCKKMKAMNTEYYNPMSIADYNNWLKRNSRRTNYEKFKYNPLISILIPVYNIQEKLLSECIDSILNQTYENFEICLVDDCSTLEETKETLKKYSQKDKRVKVKYREKNGHISATTNDALKMAKGEFVGLVDNDDVLDIDALYEVVEVLNKNKDIDMIYSDEDKINTNGQYCEPHFKPDFSPDALLSSNYICHFTVIKKELVEAVGGFEVGLEGAQDYDLFLKVTEKAKKIYHIPKMLYHWRMIEGSTSMSIDNKSYAVEKGLIALKNALKRRNINADVKVHDRSTYYIVNYKLEKEPLISIIIPTRDYLDILKKCIDSIYEKTTYKNFEIIVANNDSKEKETLDFFEKYKKKYKNFKVVDCIMDFNYSKINNIAISKCKGEYIVLLNNDTELLTPNWLEQMVGYASQEHIGTVGVKLLYPDYTIQHAGVVAGLGGVATHAHLGEERDSLGVYGRLSVPYNYSANTAACIMISRKKYEEVDGLEEKLMVAYNDIDFNFKLLDKGYYNVFLPTVELIHYESKSRGLDTSSSKYKRFLEESKYMHNKWNKYIENDPFYNKNYSKNLGFMLDKK